MAVTASDVDGIAPDLHALTLPGGVFAQVLALAVSQVNTDVWGALTDQGTLYLVCHLLTLRARGALGPSGPLTSVTVGSVTNSYAAPLIGWQLGSTPWGLEYSRIGRLLGNVALVT
jgi:hypothetical protein